VPASLTIAVVALIVPLVLYSAAVWGAFRAGTVKIVHLYMLIIGLSFNVLSVALMSVYAGGIVRDLHTLLAVFAIAGMLGIAIAGTQAYMRADDSSRRAVARWGIVPWFLWIAILLWGLVARAIPWFA
jgi:hypothetical protein